MAKATESDQGMEMRLVKEFMLNEGGATAIEYGLIAGLIAVLIIVGTRSTGSRLSIKFGAVAGNLT